MSKNWSAILFSCSFTYSSFFFFHWIWKCYWVALKTSSVAECYITAHKIVKQRWVRWFGPNNSFMLAALFMNIYKYLNAIYYDYTKICRLDEYWRKFFSLSLFSSSASLFQGRKLFMSPSRSCPVGLKGEILCKTMYPTYMNIHMGSQDTLEECLSITLSPPLIDIVWLKIGP